MPYCLKNPATYVSTKYKTIISTSFLTTPFIALFGITPIIAPNIILLPQL